MLRQWIQPPSTPPPDPDDPSHSALICRQNFDREPRGWQTAQTTLVDPPRLPVNYGDGARRPGPPVVLMLGPLAHEAVYLLPQAPPVLLIKPSPGNLGIMTPQSDVSEANRLSVTLIVSRRWGILFHQNLSPGQAEKLVNRAIFRSSRANAPWSGS